MSKWIFDAIQMQIDMRTPSFKTLWLGVYERGNRNNYKYINCIVAEDFDVEDLPLAISDMVTKLKEDQ